ncbi:cytochrome c-type biogenesis protein CcmH [Vibrio mediterranei]|jgi:cytochrome c-type biogenesis protein CcmH|uniref:cytochrome c-type biogenesis protein n=1 Tax=Vibrio barjaei TaxID=1676683 RepID=UPI0007BC3DD4|nr:cytochrome c-type biogenesis protein [Vibrio barjaei]MCG9787080.1 cytochrome c-type biogenesis protein CcmH [Vibrio mediterranei]OIN25755.1 cytochrome C nitrite reductase [Vibrio barjaei]
MLFRNIVITGLVLLCSILVPVVHGSESQFVELFEFDSPKQQKQAIELAKTLRCPMCQNQNLIESNSPVAKDIRLKVFELIKQGKTNQEVKDFMVARYGEHVLYRPSMSGHNALLWGAPIVFALGLVLVIFVNVKRRTQ